jgi:hypothetical protein
LVCLDNSSPRGTNLRIVKPEALKRVVDLINHRPRKSLDYRTPYEVLYPQPSVPVALQIELALLLAQIAFLGMTKRLSTVKVIVKNLNPLGKVVTFQARLETYSLGSNPENYFGKT